MAFRDLFPWTYALWPALNKRVVRIALGSVAVLLLTTMVSFRIQSLLFQRRVNSILSRMATLELNHTSEQEFRNLLPELKPTFSETRAPGSTEDPENGQIYEVVDSNMEGEIVWGILRLAGAHAHSAESMVNALGYRHHRFVGSCRIQNRQVTATRFWLLIETSGRPTYDDLVGVEVSGYTRAGFSTERRFQTYDDISPYLESVASNRPMTSLHIHFTDVASRDFVRAAFDVHLRCLWNLSGCHDTKQVLPEIWPPHLPWRP